MCLQSVANQTLTKGLECILVDDCGTDNSVQLAKKFINSYTGEINFSLIHRDKNGGLSAARNTGIKAATREYLYFLDSDDEITANCMELMCGLLERHGNVDLVQGSFYETQEELMTISNYQIPEYTTNQKIIKSFLLKYEGDIVGAQSRLVRRELLQQNDLYFKIGIIHEDNLWTFFLAKYVTSMAFCPNRTYYHRYNPTSITGNKNLVKELFAYKTLITDMCANIDSFLIGQQKELILSTLLTPINAHFYENDKEKKILINTFAIQNTFIEKILLSLLLRIRNKFLKTKILHLLIRIYKLKD